MIAKPKPPSDEELVSRLAFGDRIAFEEIFTRYWIRMFNAANARVGSVAAAEEIVQDIFTSIWNNHRKLFISELSSYLFSAVRKGVISNVRANIVHKKYEIHYLKSFPGYANGTEEAVDFAELSDAVEDALQKLPEKTQQVFRLNRLHGSSIPEISETLKMPRRTIEYHLTHSIRGLRLFLKDYMFIVALMLIS